MYKLYNVKTWGSLAIHCLLEEMEAPYTNIWMTPEQVRAPAFRAVSPLGMVPALGLADGRTLYESAAIVAFLVAAHPEKRMSPPIGSPDYGEFLSLLVFMSAEIYGAGNFAMDAAGLVQSETEQRRLKTMLLQRVDSYWAILEKRLASSGPWIMGSDFSALDLYAFMLSVWGAPTEEALHAKYPPVAELANAVRARPKLKAALEAHGVLKPGGYVASDLV
ncbi:MAG: glutathione S-transferase family protein [Aestuariivirga sp.]|uniref:glutathione S-transferase family protein n=1 Tax=Aestuariivirga sp. TaxID=2650926 RepID=UPI0025B99077|nr:glutathione S-transferase family protein [Aestuariivirga sp.]MCA3560273.1 glutathione S-transferase family protein [Aestuariivirga sp.]